MLTPSEKAFVAHFKRVCPPTRRNSGFGPPSDETIVDTWHEFCDDWTEAVKWGQEHPEEKVLRSDRRRFVRRPAEFLAKLEEVV